MMDISNSSKVILIWDNLNTKSIFIPHFFKLIFSWKEQFAVESGSFLDFAKSYTKFGLNINKDGDLEYREWAPSAKELSIVKL